jgi:hypothetical protein
MNAALQSTGEQSDEDSLWNDTYHMVCNIGMYPSSPLNEETTPSKQSGVMSYSNTYG